MAQSPKQLAAGHRRSLASIKKRIEAMAADWAEVDNGQMWEFENLADRIETMIDALKGVAE